MADVIEEVARPEEKIAKETTPEETVKEAIVAETAAIEREAVEAVAIETAAVKTAVDETVEAAAADSRIPIIQVKNLCKIYRVGETKVYALNDVDFTMYKGEFYAIVDPSGSGKSILLNMLAGLEKPSKGGITVGKTHIGKLKENELVVFRRRQVSFIFQPCSLLQTLSAMENVTLPLSLRGVPKKERNAIAKKYPKEVGLEKQMKHMINAMSGGQQQCVGIARALMVQPQIIFADEPIGNLDTKTIQEVLKLMRRIVRGQNQTLVMVIHDNYVASFADRQLHIVDGKIFKIDEQHHGEEEEVR